MAELRVWFICLFLQAALQGTLGELVKLDEDIDNDPPVVTCNDITLSTDLPNSFLGLDMYTGEYTYSDDNPAPSETTYNVTTGSNGDVFPPGQTPVTMFAIDVFGNQATCLFYVQNTLTELPVTCPDLNRDVNVGPGETTFTYNPDFGADDVVKSVPGYRYHGAVHVDLSIDGLPVGSAVTAGRHEVVAIISDDVLSITCTGILIVEDTDFGPGTLTALHSKTIPLQTSHS
eukprot:XP_011672039.1 PREDICTED: uncharacterized protein LOC105442024 [Strongylocentrotus purpuratus]